MKAQVFTTTQSAASARSTGATPSFSRSPSISSPSTWFFGQPRLTRWTFMAGFEYSIGSASTPLRGGARYRARPRLTRMSGGTLRHADREVTVPSDGRNVRVQPGEQADGRGRRTGQTGAPRVEPELHHAEPARNEENARPGGDAEARRFQQALESAR